MTEEGRAPHNDRRGGATPQSDKGGTPHNDNFLLSFRPLLCHSEPPAVIPNALPVIPNRSEESKISLPMARPLLRLSFG